MEPPPTIMGDTELESVTSATQGRRPARYSFEHVSNRPPPNRTDTFQRIRLSKGVESWAARTTASSGIRPSLTGRSGQHPTDQRCALPYGAAHTSYRWGFFGPASDRPHFTRARALASSTAALERTAGWATA
jgi:hypothetical protein